MRNDAIERILRERSGPKVWCEKFFGHVAFLVLQRGVCLRHYPRNLRLFTILIEINTDIKIHRINFRVFRVFFST
jgi:hypothetical protein